MQIILLIVLENTLFHYYINDSWGRATIHEQTITVESKVRENEIEVYGPNQDFSI
mgnify:CR=1 FL=1